MVPRAELVSVSAEAEAVREAAHARGVNIALLEAQLEAARAQASTALEEAAASRRAALAQAAEAASATAAAEAFTRKAAERYQNEILELFRRLERSDREEARLRSALAVRKQYFAIFLVEWCKYSKLVAARIEQLSILHQQYPAIWASSSWSGGLKVDCLAAHWFSECKCREWFQKRSLCVSGAFFVSYFINLFQGNVSLV